MSEPLWQPRTDVAARLLGAAFFCGGAALIGYQIKTIMDAAAAGAERVSYFMSAFALGEMGVILGAYWIVRGLDGYAAVRAMQTNRRAMRGIMIVAGVLIVATLLAVKTWLISLGYDE